ncbi:MAG: hypothetical protein ACREAA_19815 [Candidatus Polarisedimenticolia bacterium]
MNRTVMSFVCLLAGSGLLVHGAESRIPIYQPVVINTPGHYFLTQDITASVGSVIRIRANNVTLDLNGHTITHTALGGTGIFIDTIAELPLRGIVVRNGYINGAPFGISSYDVSGDVSGVGADVQLTVERVQISGGREGIRIQLDKKRLGGHMGRARVLLPLQPPLQAPSSRGLDTPRTPRRSFCSGGTT